MFGGASTARSDAAVLGIEMPEFAPFLLWPQFANLYRLMRHAGRQLRYGAMGGVMGFDIPAIKLIADALGIEWNKRLVEQLIQFEAMTIELFSKGTKSLQ